MIPDIVFVYGTLRLYPPHPGTDLLRGKSTFLGFGSVPGRLYDLGAFPGAVAEAGPDDIIRGEVHRLTAPDETFALLDEYEGCGKRDPLPHLFRRAVVTAMLDSGSAACCAIYWFTGSTVGRRRIPSGEYIRWIDSAGRVSASDGITRRPLVHSIVPMSEESKPQGRSSVAALDSIGPTAEDVESRLLELGDPELASFQQSFFKTSAGGYGEGDVFLGIKVPVLRRVARDFASLSRGECERLLDSAHHEARLVALVILVEAYRRGDDAVRQSIYDLYLSRTDRINGWDLVDLSAAWIVGQHVFDRDRSILVRLARSESVWERRIAIVATHYFIRRDDLDDTFRIAELLLEDRHDLIQKAVGWMLREAGKRDPAAERDFLRSRYRRMPRTMLRYAIERFPEEERKRYLRGEV